MRRNRCISCGNTIEKSALHDPYLCRDCENQQRTGHNIERYCYLGI